MMSCEKRLLRFTRNDKSVLVLFLVSVLFLMFFLSSPLFAAEVKNIRPSQVGNRVLFEFDVSGEPNEETDVSITLTINGKAYTSDSLHLEGDFGKVRAGKGKKIYWNALQDFPRGFSQNFDVEINAGGKAIKDSITDMELIFVKGGCFKMGCGSRTSDCYDSEKPVHEVCVDGFYMGKYEVTQGQWKAIMGNNPSSFKDCGDNPQAPFNKGDNCPVEQVSWNDIQEFINKLNEKTTPSIPLNKGGQKGLYRLPTEAEWEYAARSGGKSEKYSGGNDIDSVAWYDSNSGSKTHPVGQKKPNGLGIYDMSGNVWEWVHDWYDGNNYYENSPKDNPKGANSGSLRVLRGGSWNNTSRNSRTALRFGYLPDARFNLLGLRLARTQ